MSTHATLRITCPDKEGLVAATASFLARHRLNIINAQQHTDEDEAIFFHRYNLEKIGSLLESISERESLILRLRFGLDEGHPEPLTLKEIGVRIGLTRERVRQIEAEALKRLNKIINSDAV